MRMEQIRAINAILAADELPKVMGGDFNAQPGSPVMVTARQQMADTWTDVGIGSGFTHPSSHLRGRIDYLLHADGIEPVTAAVMPATGSDHRAVKATYHVTGDLGQVCLPVVQ
jgi:endonuclease/exonuclease/phosphatase (EEP) superfamily protein YafD